MKKISPMCYIYKTKIPETDWEKTSASVKARMEEMKHLIKEWGKAKAELEAKQQELLEKLNRTSKNSSSPPSADPLNIEKKAVKKKSGLKVGGQAGHKGAVRYLYSESDCAEVINLKLEFCSGCGSPLEGEDANPYRHQHVEIPQVPAAE